MVTPPLPEDLLTGKPLGRLSRTKSGYGVIGREGDFSKITEYLWERQKAVRVPGPLTKILGRPRTRGAVSSFLHYLGTTAGHQFRAEIRDNSQLHVHLLHQGKGVGAQFVLPLEEAGRVALGPKFFQDPTLGAISEKVRRPEFAARRMIAATGGRVRAYSWTQAATRAATQAVAGAASPLDLQLQAKAIQRNITEAAMAHLVYTGTSAAEAKPIELGRAAVRGSIFDVYQRGVAGVYRSKDILGGRLIDELGGESWPFPPGKADLRRAVGPIKEFWSDIEEYKKYGVNVNIEAISADAAMKGNVGFWKMGQLVPFGASANPARQLYQRWGIAPLEGGRGRRIPSVSTIEVEAAKNLVQAGKTTAETRVALVLDPRFEQYVAGGAGGAVMTPKLAGELSADITQHAKFESAKWAQMLERGGGRAISEVVPGTGIITSLGTKHVVASKIPMKGAGLAIGWETFLKGKGPEALRESVLRDIMAQAGTFSRGYTHGGKFIRYSPEVMKARREVMSPFFKRLAAAVGGTYRTVVGGAGEEGVVPQILTTSESAFGAAQFGEVSSAIDIYNQTLAEKRKTTQATGLRTIRDSFEVGYVRAGNMRLRSMFVSASVGRRLNSWEANTKGVGAWTRPIPDLPTFVSGLESERKGVEDYFTTQDVQLREVVSDLYHPGGMKIRPKDVTNVKLWHTKEAYKLANLYEGYINKWMRTEKQELAKTIAPFKQAFPSFVDAITQKEVAEIYGGYTRAAPGTPKTLAELKGTIFEASSAARKGGIAVQLPQSINISPTELEQVPTQQLYLPSLETYRGIQEGVDPEVKVHLDKVVRQHEQLMLSLSASHPELKVIEGHAQRYQKLLWESFGGKNGVMSYLSSAKMAHSGYFRILPGAPGSTLGTAMESQYITHISETAAKELGVHGLFRADLRGEGGAAGGYLYGGLAAYPGIGPSTHQGMLYKMVSDSELGARHLRMSNTIAQLLHRDFDLDTTGVTFLTQKRAQRHLRAFYEQTTLPRAKLYGSIMAEDPLLQSLANDATVAERNLRDALKTGESIPYATLLQFADDKTKAIRARLATSMEDKYVTKALTPAVDWYVGQLRGLASDQAAMLGALGGDREAMRLTGAALGLIEQSATITKYGGISSAASDIFKILGTSYRQGSREYAQATSQLSEAMLKLSGAQFGGAVSEAGQARILAATVAGGEHRVLTDVQRMSAAKGVMGAAQMRLGALREGRLPAFQDMFTKAHEPHTIMTALLDLQEREALASGPAGLQAFTAADVRRRRFTGLWEKLGGVTQDKAAMEKHANAIRAALEKEVATGETKMAAARETVLDRTSRWWSSTKTPYWQKAGLITGAAIILGAVAKNTLFPHAAPDRLQPQDVYPRPLEAMGGYGSPAELYSKPGGVWGRTSSQVGHSPSYYGVDVSGAGMPHVKPSFGPRVQMPGIGLDIGPGIAPSDSRPMVLTGPPIGGVPLPPGVPGTDRIGSPFDDMSPDLGPIARVQLPDYMTGAVDIRGWQSRGVDTDRLPEILAELGTSRDISVMMDRWDPAEGTIDRLQRREMEYSSF